MHSAALQTHRDPPRRAGFDAGLASLRRSGRGAARRRRVGSMSQPRARRRPASHLSEIVGQLPGSLEEVVFRCCLVNALPSEGSCTPPTSDGCSQGRRDSNSRCRVWSPVPWAAWRRPYVELWMVVSGKRESPPSAGRAYGGLVVYEGSLPLHEAHLPAAKGDRVLLGPLAVDGLVRSIERAVPGIHRQRHFDGAQGPHGSSFVRGLPRMERSLSEYTHPRTRPSNVC